MTDKDFNPGAPDPKGSREVSGSEALSSKMLDLAFREAHRCYPEEACGIFLRDRKTGLIDSFISLPNVQNALHAEDPQRYPRTADRAYAIDSEHLQTVLRQRAATHDLAIVFHSHADAGLYFSREDQDMAAPFGEPLFPDCSYLVCAVSADGVSGGAALYRWSSKTERFEEHVLTQSGENL